MIISNECTSKKKNRKNIIVVLSNTTHAQSIFTELYIKKKDARIKQNKN